MRVAFRTDASVTIGSGHVMRCLTLADNLRKRGAEIVFICRELPGHSIDLIRQKGFVVSILPVPAEPDGQQAEVNQWLGMAWEQDAEQCHRVLAEYDYWDWLIVDHYGIDAAWEEYQRELVDQIMVIDDLADRDHDCDVLLDQNPYADLKARYKNRVAETCQQLLGLRYVLLREEFIDQRKKLKTRDGQVRSILVFFGGVDSPDMTTSVIRAIIDLNMSDVSVNVVIGSANPHRESLDALCQTAANVQLHIQASNMAELMADADLCIGAGGTATWERCCLGLPTLAWPIADNQNRLLIDAATMGLVYAPESRCPSIEEIATHIQALMKNSLLCKHISSLGLEAVDGRGASRVVSRLMKIDVKLRQAGLDDMQKVYDWRNHEDVRMNSRNRAEINFKQHQLWFRGVLESQDRLLLIGSVDEQDVAVLRYDIDGDKAEVSVFLAPGQMGKGYGRALLAAGEKYIQVNRKKVKAIVADVMAANLVSQKLFESSGYIMSAMQYIKRFDK